jgi:hypothetical protein
VHLRTMKTNGSKAVIIVLVSLATLMMTSAGSVQGFGFISQNQTGKSGQGTNWMDLCTKVSFALTSLLGLNFFK